MILLDGSIGQELINRSDAEPTGLWGLKVMQDDPEILRAIHSDYFDAGAIVATSNTYNVLRDRLSQFDMEDKFRELHEQALGIACEARDAHGSGYVAGAMGPLGASYRPDLAPPADQAADAYAEISQIQAPYVDMFILETMASVDQARGAVMGASVPNKPIWLAVSVDDKDGTRLRSGEPLGELTDALKDMPVQVLLINCSLPEAVTQAIPLLPDTWPKGGYANGFTEITDAFAVRGQVVTDLSSRTDLGPNEYADHALRWVDDGATILGGCCEVGPAHIAKLRDRIDTEGLARAKEINL